MTQIKKNHKIGLNNMKFYKISQIRFLNTHQICMYIKKLHQIIQRQQFHLKKPKNISKKKKPKVSEKAKKPIPNATPKPCEEEDREKQVTSFLDEIKSAATEGWIQQMGMIYEPTSGMYYHPTTGYYYNAQYNLYYDGNTGTYLKYNEESFAYEFYSKVDTSAGGGLATKSSDKAKHDDDQPHHLDYEPRGQQRRRRRSRSRSDSDSLDEFGRSRPKRAVIERKEKRRHRSRSSSVEHKSRHRSRSSSIERRRRHRSRERQGWIQQMGMIYEPTSGMYYHPTTGYYYNAQYNLYYDGNTGTYLKYNEESFAYEFYSKVDTSAAGGLATKSFDKVLYKTRLSPGLQAKHDDDQPHHLDYEPRGQQRRRRRSRSRSDSDSLDEFGRSRPKRAVIERKEKRRHRSRSSSVEHKSRHRSRSSSIERRRRHRSRERRRERSRSLSRDDRHRSRRGYKNRSSRDRKSSKSRKRYESPDKNRKRRSHSKHLSSMEEGELSGASDANSSVHSNNGDDSNKPTKEFKHPRKDIAAKYPPSLRLIIKETDLKEKLKVGSLFIIPYTGGSLGREGSHDIIIPDLNVSKSHLKFSYNRDKDRYECIDLGSRNGTILNGKRMSEAGVESKHIRLKHDSIIELNKTKILCHIHEGHTTCDKCEPGIIQKAEETVPTNVSVEIMSHKEALKQLQKRYGLENEKYVEDPKEKSQASSNYKDRAGHRRKTVGSSHHNEKTVVASVDTSISSENKGFKLLSKLGWSEGQTLGKSNEGILEPIGIVSNPGTTGLGCEDKSQIAPIKFKDKRKAEILAKTQQRFANSGINSDSTNISNVLKDDDDSD
uniref:CSON002505 protein n=1 Tax=Culicoides sonorensis TaxID=179676 RepID=A0A336MQA0_CULSO